MKPQGMLSAAYCDHISKVQFTADYIIKITCYFDL